MKRIVTVVFEDDTEATVDDMQTIVAYVNVFALQPHWRAGAADTSLDHPRFWMKRIVTVTFEDGTEATIDDMQALVRYLNSFRSQQNFRTLAADTTIDWAAHALENTQREIARLQKKAALAAERAKPRGKAKDVTPQMARETLASVIVDKDSTWSASKETAKKLGFSKRTLNRRVKKSAP
jgi:hypothetical protein